MSVLADIRYSLRALVSAPVLALTIVITMAIGIGANTAVFSVVNSLVLRPLPYIHPDRLVEVVYRSADPRWSGTAVPSPSFTAWKERSRTVDGLAGYVVSEVTLLLDSGEPIRLSGASVTHDFFSTLGITATVLGRQFVVADDRVGSSPVAMLSDRFWRREFSGSTQLFGRNIRLNGRNYSVIGIVADEFQFPGAVEPDVYVPLQLPTNTPVVRYLNVIGRLHRYSSPERVEAELVEIARQAERTSPSHRVTGTPAEPRVVPLQRYILGDMRRVLLIAFGAVGFVLLLACGNVAGLLLVRTTGRLREIAVRSALGATRFRLSQWLLTERLMLASFGGVAAFVTLVLSLQWLRRVLANELPHPFAIDIDGRVFAFTVLVASLTGVVCVMIPICHFLKTDSIEGLRPASIGQIHVSVSEPLRRALVAGQIATAMILLVGALLLFNSLHRLMGVSLGFGPTNVLTLRVSPLGLFGLGDQRAAFIERVLDKIRTIPGVITAGATTSLPLAGHNFGFRVAIAGEAPPAPDAPETAAEATSAGYFQTMGVRMVAGRDFDGRDVAAAPPVAVINTVFGRTHFGTSDPIGRRLSLGGRSQDANIAIIGVVEDARDGNLGDDVRATVYRPFQQAAPQLGWYAAAIALRTSVDPLLLSETVRKEISTIAPRTAIYDFATMETRLAAKVAPERYRTLLFGLFAAAAVILATIGVYGLIAYSVSQNMHEFGIRLALGSSRSELLRLVLRRAAWPACLGVTLGFGGAAVVSGVLRGFLYGLTTTDPFTYTIAGGIMLALSILASYLPARRAMNADPIVILRDD